MRRKTALLLALAALAPQAARAESVSVLGFEAQGIPDAKAAAVTEAVRNALKMRAKVELMPGKDFVELRFLFGCTEEATLGACMAQAGRSLVVDKLVLGTVRSAAGPKKSTRVDVQIRVLDVSAEKIVGEVREVLDPASAVSPRLDAVAADWADRLIAAGAFGRAAPPAVAAVPPRVTPTPPAVETKPAETRPAETKPAAPAEDPVVVAAPSTPPAAPAPRGRALKILGGIGLGLAAAAAGAAVGTGLRTQSIAADAATTLQPIASSAYGWNNRSAFTGSTCETPPGEMPAMSNTLRQYRDLCRDGQTFAAITNALWAAAGVLAVGGATALALGVRAANTAEKPASASLDVPRLVLVPSFGPTGGGVSATLSF